MKLTKASIADVKAIVETEVLFCTSLGLPPEKEEGVRQFIENGGNIYLYSSSVKIHSAFWMISINNLFSIRSESLNPDSPLRALLRHKIVSELSPDDILVFSWTPVGIYAKWLYRIMRHEMKMQLVRAVGFVACDNFDAVRNYKRMGCSIVKSVPYLYGDNDAHYLLSFNNNSYVSNRFSYTAVREPVTI